MKYLIVLLSLYSDIIMADISEKIEFYQNVPNWSSAKKVQTGTSYSRKSLIWFTNADGVLTETYFPTIDKAQIKDSQFIVTDGVSFFADEKNNTYHRTVVLHPSLIENLNHHQKFSISHKYFTASNKALLIDEVTIIAFEDNLQFYLLVNPALNNTGYHDSGKSNKTAMHFHEGETNLYVSSNIGFDNTSMGYVGFNDGHTDLRLDYNFDSKIKNITNGNIAGTAKVIIPPKAGTYKFYITYSFNENIDAAKLNYKKILKEYTDGWDNYLSSLKEPSFKSQKQKMLYQRSLFTLKVHEDKLNPGAMIASLSKPWGEQLHEYPGVFSGGYHLVWPRDHYHVSLALLQSGDLNTPKDALGFLKRIQYKTGVWNYQNQRIIPKKGAFPQNVWTNLTEYWSGLQLDQVGFPIHLFWQTYKRLGNSERQKLLHNFKDMVYLAAEFIYHQGPWSAQERWEENFGISPSTFSVAASALIISSEVLNDPKYEIKAREWLYKPHDNIHDWTFTTTGEYGDGNYYVRVAGCSNFLAKWDPNDKSWCHIANSEQKVPMTKILDQGFLKLALMGLVPANDWKIKTSLEKVNQNIRHSFKKQYHGWYRYSYDAYGENKKGRIWPILSSEHGRYAIERHVIGDLSWGETESYVDNILESYEFFANDGLMIPEQVFEGNGQGTGAATPLAWSHAEFIKLLWSKDLRSNIENPY